MYVKKLAISVLSAILVISLTNPNIVKASDINSSSEKYDVINDVTSFDKNNKEILSVSSSKMRAVGHHTADTALFLDKSYIGQVLTDGAAADENWYYFHADAGTKLTALLEQPTDGDYDIILYKLDSNTGSLSVVASSGYGGNVIDRLSTVNNGEGYYFLRVIPMTVSTAADAVYYFVINSVTSYDSHEPNDNPSQCNAYTGSNISLSGTIDNVFDQDWTKITLTKANNYQIDFNNIPSGAQYSAIIYDENLNVKASLSSAGASKTYASLDAGNYYVCLSTYNNQFNPTTAYSFKMNETHSLNSAFHTTKEGHQIELTSSSVYIDGVYVDLNWDFIYNIFYTRSQNFRITNNTCVDAGTYKNGTFIDGQNMNASSDCICIKINNFNMIYYCSSPYESWTNNFDANSWTYFYIDANTGKTIGTDANYYHTDMNICNSFKPF